MSEDGSYASADTGGGGEMEAGESSTTADDAEEATQPDGQGGADSQSASTADPTPPDPSTSTATSGKHFTRSQGVAPPVAPTTSKADMAAKRRGKAAAQLNSIRGLLDTAAEVVDVLTQELASSDLDVDTIDHDLQEMDILRTELEAFEVNDVAPSWRAKIRREVTEKVASLAMARAVLEARRQTTTQGKSDTTPGTPAVTGHGTPVGTAAATASPAASSTSAASAPQGRRATSARASAGGKKSQKKAPPTSAGGTRARSASRNRGSAHGPPPQPLTPRRSRLLHMSLGALPPSTQGNGPGSLGQDTGGGASVGPPAPRTSSAPPPTRNSAPPHLFTVPPPPLPRPTGSSSGGGAAPPPAAAGVIPWGSAPPVAGVNLLPQHVGGGLAAPSWQQAPGQQFSPNSDALSREFYLSFPYPWNSIPQPKDVKVGDILKIASQSLPKFDGDRRMYITWRNSFIPGVHLTTIDVTYKIMLLRGSMLPTTTRMKEYIDSIVDTPEGYRQAVLTLEERYGGSAALLMTRQEDMMALPVLKEGDFGVIETLHTRLRTFLLEWEGIVGTPLTERESLAYYLALLGKVDHNYCRKYLEWVDQQNMTESLQTFHTWLSGELKRHRRTEIYSQFRLGTLSRTGGARPGWDRARGPPGGDLARPSRPPGPPPSALDRNFPRGRGFLAEGEVEVEDPVGTPPASLESNPEPAPDPVPVYAAAGAGPSGGMRPPCPLCQEDHGLGRCTKFKELTPTARKALLIKEGRCFLCFQRGHNVARCRFTFTCRHCNGKHHTLIHGADEPAKGVYFTQEDGAEDWEAATESLDFGFLVGKECLSPLHQPVARVSLRTLPVWVENPANGEAILTNAMLDDGCTSAALISKELAQKLRLKGQARWATTEGVGGHVTHYKTLFTCVRVASTSTKIGRILPAQVMERPAGNYTPVDWSVLKEPFPHLRGLPLPAPIGGTGVGIMIGNQCATLTASLEEVVGAEEHPVGRRTRLGWTAVGPTALDLGPKAGPASPPQPLPPGEVELAAQGLVEWAEPDGYCRLAVEEPTDRQLVRLLEKMLEVEDPGETEMLSPREEYIVQQARASLRLVGGQYEIGCTWAPGGTRPPLGRGAAERRLRLLEQGRHLREPRIRVAYQTVIDGWETEGFIKEVKLGEEVKHLLPHFPVVKDSESTPVRPVMDCSTALNRHLLAGPNLLNEVGDVLLRFRSGLYSYCGDVRQMFLRIKLLPEDRPFHCFLWRANSSLPMRVYQFQVHVFGNAGSPFLAVFVVREHAKKFLVSHPTAADTLIHSTLIDDVLDSADSKEEACTALKQIKDILRQAGMRLAKAHSNAAEVLSALEPAEIAKGILDVAAVTDADPVTANLKTLGLQYCSVKDRFVFNMALELPDKAWTKRRVLKLFPRLFDPLGLILPFTMIARMFFSRIAREERAWDAPLPVDHVRTWEKWVQQLPELQGFSVPRCLKQALAKNVQLHIFADASGDAFASAAYLRCEYHSSSPTVRLICAKAHVAPKNATSIPRLELLAADLAARLRQQVLRAIKVPVDSVVHWTDSTTVLYWINNDKRRLQLFVYNKVRNIQRNTDPREWRWISTEQNPADIPTRGLTACQLRQAAAWQSGPDFLLSPEEQWPDSPQLIPTPEVLVEMKKGEQTLLATDPVLRPSVLNWAKYSSWNRLQRIMHRILLWQEKVRVRLGLSPRPDLWQRAEDILVRQAQLPLHPSALVGLKEHWRQLGFTRLVPYLDGAGLWRGRGRLMYQKGLPEDVRAPLLLPKHSRAAELLLRHLHERVLHHAGGVNYLLGRLQARFWLPRARTTAFRLLQQCVPCRRRQPRPARPPEGPLPEYRLPPLRGHYVAFGVTAVDCAGPFRVKRGRSYETYYLLLFTCCQIRAVRLEWLSDLSVDAFLLALTRASARGVNPHTVLSDNGGNFTGANKLLRALWKTLPQGELEERRPEISWRFNPPYASHYGGVFERLIRAAKEALYHVLPAHLTLTLEELSTAFAVVEGILNSRPLSYASSDAADATPLTPNHFLCGSGASPLILPDSSSSFAKKWSSLQRLTSAFLKKFHQEVRPHLQLLHKVHSGGRDLKKGDIVTFLLPSSAKLWPLGRVAEVFPGPDGRVRTVEITLPPLRAGEEFRRFRRDVGEVALLLPAHQSAPSD